MVTWPLVSTSDSDPSEPSSAIEPDAANGRGSGAALGLEVGGAGVAVGGKSGPRVAFATGLAGAEGWSGVDGAHAAPTTASEASRTAAGPILASPPGASCCHHPTIRAAATSGCTLGADAIRG